MRGKSIFSMKCFIYAVLTLSLCFILSCETDYEKMSMRRLIRLADDEDIEAQLQLGLNYFLGEGTEQDYVESIRFFLMAANQNKAEAQAALGVIYFNGYGIDQNYEEALIWFTLAAKQGNEDALSWFHETAKKGYVEAQYILGNMYYKGVGLKRDYHEALKWYSLAAEKKHNRALLALGHIFYERADFAQALNYWMMAVEENCAEAQYKLGEVYYKGSIVERDYELALKWLKKSAIQGYRDAIDHLNETGIWSIGYYVDEFGIRTGEKFIRNREIIRGTFSNSATRNSPLNVRLFIEDSDTDKPSIRLSLYEYARDVPVRYPSRREWYVTVRDRYGNRLVMRAGLSELHGRLTIYNTLRERRLSSINASGKDLHNALLHGGKLMFFISVEGSASTYRFTIDNADYYDNAFRKLRESQ